MATTRSDATELKYARSEIKELKAKLGTSTSELNHYRARATKAEQEVAEWKRRFDQLLARDNKEPT